MFVSRPSPTEGRPKHEPKHSRLSASSRQFAKERYCYVRVSQDLDGGDEALRSLNRRRVNPSTRICVTRVRTSRGHATFRKPIDHGGDDRDVPPHRTLFRRTAAQHVKDDPRRQPCDASKLLTRWGQAEVADDRVDVISFGRLGLTPLASAHLKAPS